jgi:hypothetical protein
MIRPRDAPSAPRIAISARLAFARAISRFATLAHAMSNTSVTAPSSVSSNARSIEPTMSSA